MTRIILLERLRAFTEEVTADLIMPTPFAEGRHGAELPPCKGLPDAPADGTSATKKAPYVLHQVITGMVNSRKDSV